MNSASPPPPATAQAVSPPGYRWSGRVLGMLILAWIVATSVMFVDETEDVIVETLGRITAVYDQAGGAEGDRGLHFKLPWPMAIARRFDRRQKLYDPAGREMFTRDKKNVLVSSFLVWKIADPEPGASFDERPVVKFFRGLGNIPAAEARLDSRLRSVLTLSIGRIELSRLLQPQALLPPPAAPFAADTAQGEVSPLAEVAAESLRLVRQQGDETQSLRARLGIEIVDLQIKRIHLPEGNRSAVYERMRAERERIAERYRSAGGAEKSRIESQGRRQSSEILSRAESDAERIRGEGEAAALAILNEAYIRDPEFFEFQRKLALYARVLGERTTLVLSASSRLFQLLTEGVGDAAAPQLPVKREAPAAVLPGAVPSPRTVSGAKSP